MASYKNQVSLKNKITQENVHSISFKECYVLHFKNLFRIVLYKCV